MITLVVKIDVKPDNFFDFVDATRIARDKALATEPQCHAYTINKDPDNENGVILVEVYENQHAIDLHKTTEHFLEWREAVKDMGERKATRYDSI